MNGLPGPRRQRAAEHLRGLSTFRIAVVAAFACISLAMGLLFSVLIPPWQAPDEPRHVEYAIRLSEKGWFLQPQFKRANSPANLHISMNRSTVHQAEAFLKDFEETIEELKKEEISDEARELQAELEKLSLEFDDETFFKLASMAGVTGTELPDKMEKINQIMEVLPYDVSEWILIEFLNNLMVQKAE